MRDGRHRRRHAQAQQCGLPARDKRRAGAASNSPHRIRHDKIWQKQGSYHRENLSFDLHSSGHGSDCARPGPALVAPEAAVAGEYEDALADVVDLGLDTRRTGPVRAAGLILCRWCVQGLVKPDFQDLQPTGQGIDPDLKLYAYEPPLSFAGRRIFRCRVILFACDSNASKS